MGEQIGCSKPGDLGVLLMRFQIHRFKGEFKSHIYSHWKFETVTMKLRPTFHILLLMLVLKVYPVTFLTNTLNQSMQALIRLECLMFIPISQ